MKYFLYFIKIYILYSLKAVNLIMKIRGELEKALERHFRSELDYVSGVFG